MAQKQSLKHETSDHIIQELRHTGYLSEGYDAKKIHAHANKPPVNIKNEEETFSCNAFQQRIGLDPSFKDSKSWHRHEQMSDSLSRTILGHGARIKGNKTISRIPILSSKLKQQHGEEIGVNFGIFGIRNKCPAKFSYGFNML